MATVNSLLLAFALMQVPAPPAAPPAPPPPSSHPDIAQGPESFSMRVVASGLEGPWDVLLGPDGWLWVTERSGKRVTRINPANGSRKTAITIPDVAQTHTQNGLLGMALHSGFLTAAGPNDVYVAMTYDADPGAAEDLRLMIRRYTYDAATETLGSPMDLLKGLPSGSDHVSGRLIFGRDSKLYLTIGDKGFNQFSIYCNPIISQDLPTPAEVAAGNWRVYEGKVIRVNLDGSIPADNPVLKGVRSHIYSYGHRNAQGLVQARDGKIYSSEHGPSMDDELNLIQAGRNYGWPYVAGYRDDRVYVYANWSAAAPTPCASLTWDAIIAPPTVPQQKETAWNDPVFMPPIRTFFTVGPEYNFTTQGNATIAPSGIDVYSVPAGGIPDWSDSVLVTSLLRGVVYRVKLGPGGTSTTGKSIEDFHTNARYRDVLVAPDGRTIYVVSESGSQQNPGSILGFTYAPTTR